MSDNQEVLAPNLSNVQQQIKQVQELLSLEEPYTISLVTPIFGGGSKAGKIDKQQPIREASIRGHLRFWWRATCGASYTNVLELRREEVAIFGDTTTPSRVKIWVESSDPPLIKTTLIKNVPPPSYVLFPVRSNPVDYLENYDFRLHIRYEGAGLSPQRMKALQQELHAALWAWINFGGLGSRTRRGAGSLYCPEFSPPRGKNLQQWYREKIEKYELQLLHLGQYRDWPTLSSSIFFNGEEEKKLNAGRGSNANLAWKSLINTYHCFRQRRNTDQDGNKRRSLWPEPDSIRKIMGMQNKDHRHLFTLEKEELRYAFPRSQLGMPIITTFHKDDHGDPYTTELLPVGKDRLASPLILKVVALDKTNGVGAIIVLNHKPITGLKFKRMKEEWEKQPHRNKSNPGKLSFKEKQIKEIDERLNNLTITPEHIYSSLNYNKSPMKINDESTNSAIEAFLNSKEVQRWKQGHPNTPPKIKRP
ncbi:type III-B CRISPR module RAMP protein Cmr1 [Paenibacillus sp. GCM10012306]|uniref:type III-B CRISPR module RAMP protein Cmr1 n=1 Tax=Paenibacillus sp. GCM10012306 TaxID=3317342 RepID=UPI003611D290